MTRRAPKTLKRSRVFVGVCGLALRRSKGASRACARRFVRAGRRCRIANHLLLSQAATNGSTSPGNSKVLADQRMGETAKVCVCVCVCKCAAVRIAAHLLLSQAASNGSTSPGDSTELADQHMDDSPAKPKELFFAASNDGLMMQRDSKELAEQHVGETSQVCVWVCLWFGAVPEQGRRQVCASGSSLLHCRSSFAVTGGYQ